MKVMTMEETEVVSGGVCENMSLAQCIDGVGNQAGSEIEAFASHVSSWWNSYRQWNMLGIWLYNATHDC